MSQRILGKNNEHDEDWEPFGSGSVSEQTQALTKANSQYRQLQLRENTEKKVFTSALKAFSLFYL